MIKKKGVTIAEGKADGGAVCLKSHPHGQIITATRRHTADTLLHCHVCLNAYVHINCNVCMYVHMCIDSREYLISVVCVR